MRSTWGLGGLYHCCRGGLEGLGQGYVDLRTRVSMYSGKFSGIGTGRMMSSTCTKVAKQTPH
jgi:hypothetical protein